MKLFWRILDWLFHRERDLDFTLNEKLRQAWIFGRTISRQR